MAKVSAGLLLYKIVSGQLSVLLAHPGGPFFAKKDIGAWTIPKGEFENDETPIAAARREFAEELGQPAPEGELIALGESKQPGGKVNHVWALNAEFDASHIVSNNFEMEWPPKSGRTAEFPEIDRAAWFSAGASRVKLRPAQVIFLDRLEDQLGLARSEPEADGQLGLDFS